jgi:hypothetical protein
LFDNALDKVLDQLNTNALAFSPFYYDFTKKYERHYQKSFSIPAGIKSVEKYIYCSILFSGLIFKSEYVNDIKSSRFKNLNYFQVYLFSTILSKYGGQYINIPLVQCLGDGENAFGISDSSKNNTLLADRRTAYSNLEYHKGLIKTIKIFDNDNKCNLIDLFSKNYSLRSYSGMVNSRRRGKKELVKYWEKMNDLGIKISFVAKIYYYLLYVFGCNISDFMVSIPKYITVKIREVNLF